MATAFSKLKRASFEGIEFPVRRMSVRGALRYHVHEYPHAFGGAFENLQRKLYETKMTCPFMQRFAAYPGLWPDRWNALRARFETGEAGQLVIPTIGTITVRCIAWPEEMDAKIQSGVNVELEFIEDQSQLSLVENLIRIESENLQAAIGNYEDALAKFREDNPNSLDAQSVIATSARTKGTNPSLFDSINDAANALFSIKDQFDLQAGLLEGKVLGLLGIIQEADRTVVSLQNPQNFRVWTAMRDLADGCRKLAKDLHSRHTDLQVFIVPMTMAISDVSTRIYGDNSRAVELMQINSSFDDALAIPAGTQIKYYPAVANAA